MSSIQAAFQDLLAESSSHQSEEGSEESRNSDPSEINVQDVLDSFESRALGPFLMLPAFVALAPTGGIPGVPTTVGLFVVIISIQLLWGVQRLWLPEKIKTLGVDKKKFEKAYRFAKPAIKRFDQLLKKRWEFLTHGVGEKITALICIVLALLMIPLEMLPFAVMLPASAIFVYGLSLVAQDGLAVCVGHALSLGALYTAYSGLV